MSVYSEVVFSFLKLLQVWAMLLAVSPALAGYAWEKSVKDVATPPSFDMIIKEIDANVGETVLLPCTVRNLGDKVISWIRTRDLSILTSGAFTFSADNRIETVYSSEADFWGLRIRGVKVSDTGQYECQVNTDPKMNLAVNLSVADTRQPAGMRHQFTSVATIKSPKEIYVRVGSPVSLTCEISALSKDSSLPRKARVRWIYKGREITSESDRGGISVDTDYRERKITSRLRVSMATVEDGGFYTCTHESTRQDSVNLHVVEAEHTEAMQRDAAYSSAIQLQPEYMAITMYLFLYII